MRKHKSTLITPKTVTLGKFDSMIKKIITSVVALASLTFTSAVADIELYILRSDWSETGERSVSIVQLDTLGNTLGTWNAPSTNASDRVTVLANNAYGSLRASTNGSYLVFGGTDSPAGTTDRDNNVIARFSVADGTFDTSTRLSGDGLYRSVVTHDGTGYWRHGNSAANGVHYVAHGASTSTNISSSGAGMDRLRIHEGTLYSSRSGTGVYDFGPLPFPDNPNLPLGTDLLPGISSARDFFFFNGTSTLFVDLGTSSTLRVAEWDPIEEQYDLLGGTDQSLTGIGVYAEFALSPYAKPTDEEITIFFTSDKTVENNSLWSVTWNTDAKTFGTPTKIADAGEGYSFAGVVAIPEPGTYALLFGAFAVSFAAFVRRRFRT